MCDGIARIIRGICSCSSTGEVLVKNVMQVSLHHDLPEVAD
jgi:hypothetical protein